MEQMQQPPTPLDLQAQPEEPKEEISLTENVDTPTRGQDLVNRVFRYHVALGDDSPGVEKLKTDLASGLEDQYKDTLQRQEMQRRDATSKQLVLDEVNNNPDADPLYVAEMAKTGEPPNRSTILEESWAKKATDSLMAADDNSQVAQAMLDNPMGVGDDYEAFQEITWKQLLRNTWKNKIDQKVEDMGWGSYLTGFGAQLIQYPTWANIALAGDEGDAWYTAGALRDKVAAINALPPVEMDAAIRAEVERLSAINTLDAQKFVHAVVSYSATDYDLNILDDLTMIPVGTMAKAAGAGIRSATEANEIAQATAKMTRTLDKAVKEARTVVENIPAEKVGETIVDTQDDLAEAVDTARQAINDLEDAAGGPNSPIMDQVEELRGLRNGIVALRRGEETLWNKGKTEQQLLAEAEAASKTLEGKLTPRQRGLLNKVIESDRGVEQVTAKPLIDDSSIPDNTRPKVLPKDAGPSNIIENKTVDERTFKLNTDKQKLVENNQKLWALINDKKALQQDAVRLSMSMAKRENSLRGQIKRNLELIKKLDQTLGEKAKDSKLTGAKLVGRGPTKIVSRKDSLEGLLEELGASYDDVNGKIVKPIRPGLLDEIKKAMAERRRAGRKINQEHIDPTSGEKYLIKEITNEAEMPKVRGNTPAGAIVYPKKAGEKFSIFLNKPKIYRAFEAKTWVGKDGVLPDGATAFPPDAFSTIDEFIDFIIEHEIAHIKNQKLFKGKQPLAEMEDMVTRDALRRMQRHDLIKRMWPDLWDSPQNRAASELSATSKAVSSATSIEDAAAGAGNPRLAAKMSIQRYFTEMFMGDKTPGALKNQFLDIANHLPSLSNVKVKGNVGENFSNNLWADMEPVMKRFIDLAAKTAGVVRVSRLTPEALQIALDKTEEFLRKNYNRLQDRILDIDSVKGVEQLTPGMSPTNVAMVKINFGDANRGLFNSLEEAQAARKEYGLNPADASIEETAGKYYIQAYAPVREDNIIDLDINPVNGHKLDTFTWMKRWIGGGKVQHGEFQNMQRSAVVHSEQQLGAIVREIYEPFEALGKRSRKAIDEIMKHNQVEERIPGRPDTRGMYYQNSAELQQGFMTHLKRLPTEAEEKAYFAVVRAADLDYIYRSFGEYRRKAISGIERVTIPWRRVDKDDRLESLRTTVEAKLIPSSELPLNTTDDIGVLLQDLDGKMTLHSLKDIKSMVGDLSAYDVYRPDKMINPDLAFMGGGDVPVAFIVTKKGSSERNPIRLNEQVSYRQGFHNVYKAPFFLKQARIRGSRYEGDVTAMGFATEAQMRKFGSRMEKARQLLVAGDDVALEAYLKDNLPYGIMRFKSLFKEHLDPNVPFAYVKRDTSSLEGVLVDGRKVQDAFPDVDTTIMERYSLSSGRGDPFVAKRDALLQEIRGGTEDNPALELADAELLSPMLTQTKVMGKLIKSELYDDYQLTSAANYIEAFKNDIWYAGEKVPLEELRANPAFYLSKGEIRSTNPQRVAQAKALKDSIENLMRNPTQLAMWLDNFKLKLMSKLYEKTGEKYLKYIPDKAIPFIDDPISYMRSVAFHTKLGFFNPIQFFVQGMAFTNVIAIAPVAGTKAVPAVLAMSRLALTRNEKIAEEVATRLASMAPGWTKESFLDSWKTMNRAGFNTVGAGSAWRNDLGDPTIYRSAAGKLFLDKGPMFFQAGESAVRYTAWNTAYLEFIEKNKGKIGKLNEFDIAKIRERADNLSGNMTRNANSFWQNDSRLSLFTQFWSYNVRMAELMMSPVMGTKLLNHGEAARLALAQAALWGSSPLAAAAYYFESGGDAGALQNEFIPFSEDLAAYTAQAGFNMDGTNTEAFYNGMMSKLFEAWTGEKLDFGSRYGMSPPQVFDTLKRTMREDGEYMAVVVSAFGPSGSIVNDIFKESSTVLSSIYDLVNGEGTYGETLPMDIANAFREVSSVNFVTRIAAAASGERIRAQTGSVISENEDPPMEMLKSVLGVENVDTTTAFAISDAVTKQQREHEKVKRHARRYLGPYWDALKSGDREAQIKYGRILKIYLDSTDMTDTEKVRFLYPKEDDGRPMEELLWKKAIEKTPSGIKKENMEAIFNEKFGN